MIAQLLRAVCVAIPLFIVACSDGASSEGAAKTDASATAAKADGAKSKGDKPVSLGDMGIGAENAPVTVIEYASVTCPHCAAFHEEVFPTIKANYIDTGKVRFIFREFPTPPVEFSFIGSVLARCAADKAGPDAYMVVLDTLFRTQQTWIYGADPKGELLKIASQVGMNDADFDACLQRQEVVDLINANVEEGSSKYEITGTPSFVVQGERVTLKKYEELSGKIDEALAKAAEKKG